MKKIASNIVFFIFCLMLVFCCLFIGSCGKNKNDSINTEQNEPDNNNNPASIEPTVDEPAADEPTAIDPYVDLFRSDNSRCDKELLKLANYFALNCFDNESKTKTLLQARGFNQIQCDKLNVQNEPDGVASVIALRKIGDENLVLVVIRGINYSQEWIANFKAGLDGDIKGFNDALNIVVERLDNYLEENEITNFKIMACGYSRGAGITNLFGVYLNENLTNYGLDKDDLFIYTFEAPHSSVSSVVYDNIVNVYNENDLVTYFYPENDGWNIYLNGIPYIIKDPQLIRSYYDFSFTEGKYIRVNAFFLKFLDLLARNIDRETYVQKVQPLILYALDLYYNHPTTFDKLEDFIINDLVPYFSDLDNLPLILKANLQMIQTYHSEYLYDRAIKSLEKIIDEKAAGKNIMLNSEWEQLKSYLFDSLKAIAPLLVDDLKYRENIDYEKYYQLIEPLYNISDYDRGIKDGKEDGMRMGYFDGVNNTTTPKGSTSGLYGEVYVASYDEAYDEYYVIGKTLGIEIRDNMQERGLYDGNLKGLNDGINDGSRGNAYNPKLLTTSSSNYKEWMDSDYLEAYNSAYLASYDAEYQTRHEYLESLGAELPLYHIATFIKNIDYLIANHDGSYNCSLLEAKDA